MSSLDQPYGVTRPVEQARLLSDRNAALLVAGSIDPESYVLGPGDLVGFELLGAYSISAEDVVGADGSVTFPQLGTVWIGNRTLAEAREEIRKKSHSLMRQAEPLLLLKSPRIFKVYVTGSVQTIGSQGATPLTRVSEVLQSAGGLRPGADSRNILITHRDSTTTRADLLPFLLSGQLEMNPALLDGDVVTVRPRTQDLVLLGAVLYPGRYDFVDGDEMGTLLRLVGLHPKADSTRAVLQRSRDGVRWDTLSVELGPVLQHVAEVPLRAGDRILIRALGDWRTGSTAEVRGTVAFPGPIPVERGKVTAAQAVELAGGFLPDAVPERVVLSKPFLPDSTGTADPSGSENFLTDLSATRIHERIVDLTKGSGPILEPGDVLYVPRVEPWVEVLGQVENPGFYNYYAEWKVEDYVRAAGGYEKFADPGKTQVSKGRFGDVGYAKDSQVLAPGDLIWVPEKTSKSFWTTFREVIAVAGQAAALVLIAKDITN